MSKLFHNEFRHVVGGLSQGDKYSGSDDGFGFGQGRDSLDGNGMGYGSGEGRADGGGLGEGDGDGRGWDDGAGPGAGRARSAGYVNGFGD